MPVTGVGPEKATSFFAFSSARKILGQKGSVQSTCVPALLTIGVDGLAEGLSLGKDKGHNDAVDGGQRPQRCVFIAEDSALGTAAGTVFPWASGEQGVVPE